MEINETLNKLVENTEEIKKKIETLEEQIKSKDNEIESLNNEIENLKNQSSELDGGLLGNLKDIQWTVENNANYEVNNDTLIALLPNCLVYQTSTHFQP